jgi:uncharacterized protein (UPF0335 family)
MEKLDNVVKHRLKEFVEAIENRNSQIRELNDEIKDLLGNAKSVGFDIAIIKEIVRIRKLDQDRLQEKESLIGIYLDALNETE